MGHKPFVQDRGPSHRPARFAQILKEELTQMISDELKDHRLEDVGFITLTSVSVTPDLKNAMVMFAVMSEEDRKKHKEIEAALNHAAGFLRSLLVQKLQTKVTPHLTFRFDKGAANAGHIDELLKTVEPPKPDSDE